MTTHTLDTPATIKTKVGAPRGNTNAARHGMTISRLSLGNMPPRWANVGRVCSELRRALENAVAELRGEVNLTDAATIQTAVRYERHAQLAQKWLRDNPDMAVDVRMEFSHAIAHASSQRDKAIKALGIDKRPPPGDVWDDLYRRTIPVLPAPATQTPASDAPVPTDSDTLKRQPGVPESGGAA